MIYINREWCTNNMTLTICYVIWMVRRFLKLGNVSFVKQEDLKNITNVFVVGFGSADTIKDIGSNNYLSNAVKYMKDNGCLNENEFNILCAFGKRVSTDDDPNVEEYKLDLVKGGLQRVYNATIRNHGVDETIKTIVQLFDVLFDCELLKHMKVI